MQVLKEPSPNALGKQHHSASAGQRHSCLAWAPQSIGPAYRQGHLQSAHAATRPYEDEAANVSGPFGQELQDND